MKFKIGTYTKKNSEGIYEAELLENKITIRLLHRLDNPTYIDEKTSVLVSVVKDENKGGVAFYKEGIFINQVVENGAPPCFVYYDEVHELVYSANYHEGQINTYRFELNKWVDHQKFSYPTGSHAHYIVYHEAIDEVVVCDLGNDKVYFYEVSNKSLILKSTFVAEKGSGPRHAVVHPKNNYVYVFCELSSEILVLKREGSSTIVRQTISTLPAANVQKWGAAIRLSKDGKFLYVSNRGHNSISVFSVEDQLRLIQNISSYGIQPRDFNLSPCNKYCIVANLDSNNLVLFDRDEKGGKLRLIEKDIECFEPVCILFEE